MRPVLCLSARVAFLCSIVIFFTYHVGLGVLRAKSKIPSVQSCINFCCCKQKDWRFGITHSSYRDPRIPRYQGR